MKANGRTCLICNCEGTMPLDAAKISDNINAEVGKPYSHLCRSQLSAFEAALSGEQDLVVACQQEAPLFQEIAEENGLGDRVSFINIRETAGWSDQAEKATAKISALLGAVDDTAKPARLKSIEADGMCLVYGAGQQALEMAQYLARTLSVTLLLSDQDDLVLPQQSDIPIYRGDIETMSGSFGGFSLTVNNYAPLMPSARKNLEFVLARDGASTTCSLVLDISGKTPLVTGHAHRDGYKRVDPGDPAAILRAVIEMSDMVGEFEKPIYVDYNAETCAHGRSQKTGCTKCLDTCPAGAISDLGDTVSIDPGICGGCGSCHAVCPTGSITYQYPVQSDLIANTQSLITRYRSAGGKNPVLLLHDHSFGADMIAAMARYGRGLPAHVIPQAVHAVSSIGHVEIAALIASGWEQVHLLANPQLQDELDGTRAEIELAGSILSGLGLAATPRCQLICEADPDTVENAIWSSPDQPLGIDDIFNPIGSKRDIARLAFVRLQEQSATKPDTIDLPAASPYGRVNIDQSSCTLCMACTSACPANAIVDTPGEPKLRFVENACVQCGLCVSTCPESALVLEPRLNFTSASMQPVTLYEEEPFNCIVCDTPFATKSTIERITTQLAGKHTMFASEERSNLIKMCENCRVEAQANSSDDPFASGQRPRVRTTEDYIEAEKGNLTADDFLIDD